MKWAALALAVVAVGLLAWQAGEQHYQSCVAAVNARAQPWDYTGPSRSDPNSLDLSPPTAARGGSEYGVKGVSAELSRCSRLPF